MFGKFNENQLNVVTILGKNGYCLLANGHIRLRFQMSVNVKPFLGKVKPFRGVFVDNCKFMISVQIWGRGGEKEKGEGNAGLGNVDNVDNLVHNSFLA